jgi:hypothetical protein
MFLTHALRTLPKGPPPVPPPTTIGQAYGGGYYIGQISTSANSVATHYLVIGPLSSAESSSAKYQTSAVATGATSAIDGPANTVILKTVNSPIANFCTAVTAGGYTDWYVPAKNELEVCYYNAKPTTNANRTDYGINPNAVPARASNYTTGNPAQTSAAVFVAGGTQAFVNAAYWSSTEVNYGAALREYFVSGYFRPGIKSYSYRIRAIRRVAV